MGGLISTSLSWTHFQGQMTKAFTVCEFQYTGDHQLQHWVLT